MRIEWRLRPRARMPSALTWYPAIGPRVRAYIFSIQDISGGRSDISPLYHLSHTIPNRTSDILNLFELLGTDNRARNMSARRESRLGDQGTYRKH
jgi:hypothetical protein